MKLTLLSLASSIALVVAGLACDRSGASAAPSGVSPASAPGAAVVETNSYKLEIKPVGTYKKGQQGAFEIVLKTKPEWHVNEDYPTKFKAAEGAGVTYAKPKIEKMKEPDAFVLEGCASGKDKCTLKLNVKFTPDATGNVKVGGELQVGVCNKETCLVEKKQLDLSISVS